MQAEAGVQQAMLGDGEQRVALQVGMRLRLVAAVQRRLKSRATGPFEPNTAAVAALGLTRQEVKVLERLAAGQSNKEIARTLGVSPNTVKTHAANLFSKLEVSRRTQAVSKARDLLLIP